MGRSDCLPGNEPSPRTGRRSCQTVSSATGGMPAGSWPVSSNGTGTVPMSSSWGSPGAACPWPMRSPPPWAPTLTSFSSASWGCRAGRSWRWGRSPAAGGGSSTPTWCAGWAARRGPTSKWASRRAAGRGAGSRPTSRAPRPPRAVALMGEASPGTAEFYAARAGMTRRLIEERGFCAVAAEADWPDAYRVNRYVRGRGDDVTAEEALRGFERFPAWMWRNAAVLEFAGWLREHNDRSGSDERAKAGFYGLDLYSLYRSVHEIITYLDRVDPAAAARARERYACFDHFSADDAQVYGFAAAFGAGEPCEREVVEQLADFQRHALEYARRDGLMAEDELFYAEQNVRTVQAAERYYRAMFSGRVSS